MRVTYKQLAEGIPALREVAKQVTKPQYSVALAQALREIEPNIELLAAEENKIMRRHWVDTGNGAMSIQPSKRDAFDAEIKELHDAEVVLHHVGRLKMKTLTDAGATVSGETLYKLGWMLKTDDIAPAWDEAPDDEETKGETP